MKKVSIIVPVYNVEQYLEACVESIIQQSYKNVEIILIDDGSTDKSSVICDQYSLQDERIVVIHKENGGLSSARNLGIELARGEYLIFIDSDDYWFERNCLANLVKLAEEFNADVVRGEYISINDKGEQITTITKPKYGFDLRPLDSASFYINAIAGENFSVLFLFRKSSIGSLRFDESLNIQEDIDFNIKFYSLHRNCIYSREVFYVYRKRANSITTLPRIPHLIDSFYMCDVFEKYACLSDSSKVRKEYQRQSVLKYQRTLVAMSEEPYYSNLHEIKKTIELGSIYLKAMMRIVKYRIIERKALLCLLPPLVYVRLLHLKVTLYKLLVKN